MHISHIFISSSWVANAGPLLETARGATKQEKLAGDLNNQSMTPKQIRAGYLDA